METALIDVVLAQWEKQDAAGVPRWAFFVCGSNKKPYYPKGHKFGNGHNSATTDPDTAREMFKDFTTRGNFIAVAGGYPSGGVCVIDIDIKKEDTPELYKNPDNIEKALENLFGDIPKTESQTTISGGRHLLFYDKKINSMNDAFDFKNTGLSIDIKGNGGYFILYDDDINFENISDSPSWLSSYLSTRKKEQKKSSADFSEILTEGNRNSGLTAIAGKFYNYGDSADVLKSFLHGHNLRCCKPPLPEKDVERIIKSVLDNFTREYEKTDLNDEEREEYDFNCLADFCTTVEDQKFTIQGMITESSLSVLTGKSGSGKTWGALDMCLSIAQGLEWMGQETIQKNVLIVDEESGKDRLKRRMRKMVAGRGLMDLGKEKILDSNSAAGKIPIKALTFRRTDISLKSFVTVFRERIIKDNIGFIVFDSLVVVTPGKNENDAKEMLPALLNLKQLCEETGVTILVIHHAGKTEGSNSRGTSAIEGGCDAMFKISQPVDNGNVTFESVKERDIKRLKFGIKIEYSDYSVTLEKREITKDEEIKKTFTQNEEKIIKALYENKNLDKNEIHKIVKGEINTVRSNLNGLFTRGFLVKETVKNRNIWNIHEDKHFDIKRIFNKNESDV
jgi:hypothetical protein